MLEFSKYHGTGNDFVMVTDLDDAIELSPKLVAAICDRRFGVGADGVIRITGAEGADFFMDYRNADGSVAEMCGNGVRCLARLIHDRNLSSATTLAIDTRAGIKTVSLNLDGDRLESVTVDMGPPAFARSAIPMRGPAWEGFQMQSIEAAGRTFTGSDVSMGNPHLVLFVDEQPADMPVISAGPLLETHEAFPEKTNVEFVHIAGDRLLTRVWERGVGETMACGTGACAVLAAANEAGLAPARAEVVFPGGTLTVERTPEGTMTLTGPAEHVFDGRLDPALLEGKQG
jgi:diaminopimelate epimerase